MQQDNFFADIHKNRELNSKHLFELMIWYACNANCVFCSNNPELRKVDPRTIRYRTAEVMHEIAVARKDGYRILGLSGGEPTIYPDILKVLAFAKKLGFEVIRIQTNAIRLSNYDFCQKIIEAGANFIKFSIHGHKAALHDKLTMVPGSYDMVMAALDNLAELEVATEINFVVNRENFRFIPQFIVSMFNKSVSKFVIIFPTYEGRMKTDYEKWGVKLSDAAPYIKEAIKIVEILGLDKVIIMNVPACFLRGYEAFASGRTVLGIKVSTPNGVSDSSAGDFDAGYVKAPVCSQCTYSDRCNGVYATYADVYGVSELEPIIG
jgi:MoaA/NifB/PqqE/SkfB family radical SAM enzyme